MWGFFMSKWNYISERGYTMIPLTLYRLLEATKVGLGLASTDVGQAIGRNLRDRLTAVRGGIPAPAPGEEPRVPKDQLMRIRKRGRELINRIRPSGTQERSITPLGADEVDRYRPR